MSIKPKQILIFCLSFLVMMTLPSFAAKGKLQPPDYFPLPKEAVWEYQSTTSTGGKSNFTVTVVDIEKQTSGDNWYKVETKSTQSFYDWYSKPTGEVLMHRERGGQDGPSNYDGNFEPPKQFLKNPLAVGQRWTWKGQRPGIVPVDVEESNQVAVAEKIQVPAGKFDSLKVITEVSQGGAQLKKTYWYASGIGLIKGITESENFTSTSELVKYHLKH
jgi:hypothetical protein